jgi:hypothetical protein
MSALDDAHATIRKLRAALQGAVDEIAALRTRLDYAEGQIRSLRARVVGKVNRK